MKKKLHEDVFVGLILIAIGVAIYLQGSTYNSPSVDPLGSSFYPRMIGVLLMGGGLLMTITNLIVSIRTGAANVERNPINLKVVGTFLLSIAYVVVIGKLGFLITNILFMVSCLLILGERDKKKIVMIPLAFTVGLLVLFQFLLDVNLPIGLLWG